MEKGIKFRCGKKITDLAELKIGSYYKFYNELYLYCGRCEPFSGAYAFQCIIGTLYINKKAFDEIVETDGIREAFLCKDQG